jgi:regulatory protein
VRRRADAGGRTALAPEAASDPRAIRKAALEILARRDHPKLELERKLADRGFAGEAVGPVVAELAAKHLLDDDRYIEHFVSYHAARGQGPLRIRADLRQRGLQAEAIERQLEAVTDWRAHARSARRKKFGAELPRDFRQRARQARFLEYRGFSAEHIRAALEGEVESDA